MNEIFFLIFAFLTVFLSIKLSYYADLLSKTSGVSKALVGGIVLAGVTSLPEFVTCFSAMVVDNPALAIGDIIGSNLFNLFMICFFDIVFIKKMIFSNTSRSHNIVVLILILNYLAFYLFVSKIFDFSLLSIGFPSILIIATYILYLKKIPKFEVDSYVINEDGSSKKTVVKLAIVSLCMAISSVLLTIVVNNISIAHPSFSSSFLGAIFLGITTSLPEVVTFYALINIKSYDIAVSNIIGSCLFNLLVLAIGDIVFLGYPVYMFSDNDTLILVILGLLFLVSCLIINYRKRCKNLFSYGFISFLVIVVYLVFWLSKFL